MTVPLAERGYPLTVGPGSVLAPACGLAYRRTAYPLVQVGEGRQIAPAAALPGSNPYAGVKGIRYGWR